MNTLEKCVEDMKTLQQDNLSKLKKKLKDLEEELKKKNKELKFYKDLEIDDEEDY